MRRALFAPDCGARGAIGEPIQGGVGPLKNLIGGSHNAIGLTDNCPV